MLNYVKIAEILDKLVPQVVAERTGQLYGVRHVWQAMAQDLIFPERLKKIPPSPPLAYWQHPLLSTYAVERQQAPYAVASVDGSQIYPDRHQAIACYMLQVGTVFFSYQITQPSTVVFSCEPHIFVSTDEESVLNDVEVVHAQRTELELLAGLAAYKKNNDQIILFDGTLSLSEPSSTAKQAQQSFFHSKELLQEYTLQKVPVAGYISLSKGRELVNCLRLFQREKNIEGLSLHHLVDADLMQWFLPVYHRTQLFMQRSVVMSADSCVYFFYLNVGKEIVRIELLPSGANDEEFVSRIARVALDQALKGDGYPVCLSEAHEQAVVKDADRECFYHVLRMTLAKQGIAYVTSQKSTKKRMIAI